MFVDQEVVAAGSPHVPTIIHRPIALSDFEFGITQDGDVYVKGTQVHPDYVFEPDYELMPLDELKDFVARERHLPDIPTAKDIEENGLNLTLFQARLLEKVEELTLYLFDQDEKLAQLKSQNGYLRDENRALEDRMIALEQRLASSE